MESLNSGILGINKLGKEINQSTQVNLMYQTLALLQTTLPRAVSWVSKSPHS